MTRSQSSSVILNSRLSRVMPALLTSTSTLPSSSTTRGTAASTAAESATSQPTPIAWRGAQRGGGRRRRRTRRGPGRPPPRPRRRSASRCPRRCPALLRSRSRLGLRNAPSLDSLSTGPVVDVAADPESVSTPQRLTGRTPERYRWSDGAESGFRFAAWLALAMVAAMLVVAWIYDLPVRDPDSGAGPTYLRLPAILLAAFLVDVLPRALWRARSRPGVPCAVPGGGARALAAGSPALRAARPRRLVPHLPRVPEPEVVRALRQQASVGRRARRRRPVPLLRQRPGRPDARRSRHRRRGALLLLHLHRLDRDGAGLAGGGAGVDPRPRGRRPGTSPPIAVDWVLGVATYFALPDAGADLRPPRALRGPATAPTSPACRR